MCIDLVDEADLLDILSQAFDEHMNLVMGEVEETTTRTSKDEATGEEVTSVRESSACIEPCPRVL